MTTTAEIAESIERRLSSINDEIANLKTARKILVDKGREVPSATKKAARKVAAKTSRTRMKKGTALRPVAETKKAAETKKSPSKVVVLAEQSEARTKERKARRRPGQLRTDVVSLIRNEPGISTPQIADKLGTNRTTIYPIANLLKKDGAIAGSHQEGWVPTTQLRLPPRQEEVA